MNISLTMTFDSVDELQTFLNRNPAARNTPVATLEPVPDVVEATVAAAAKVDLTAVDPLEGVIDPLGDITPDPVEDISPEDMRAELMGKLKALAGSMDDAAVLGKFINGFGVTRFSELGDDQLVAFSAAINAEFGI